MADPKTNPEARESAKAILTAALRSDHLIDGLLALARSETSVVAAEPVDLAEIAGDVAGECVAEATRAGVAFSICRSKRHECEAIEPCSIKCWPI